MSPRQASTLRQFPVFGTNISIGSAEDISKEINSNVKSGIYMAPQDPYFPPGMSRSVSAERIDVDANMDKTSMFDIDIVKLKKGKSPLERIYFDCQKARGVTSKSLMLAAKMQRESHPHNSDNSDNESTHSTRSATSGMSDDKPVERLNT